MDPADNDPISKSQTFSRNIKCSKHSKLSANFFSTDVKDKDSFKCSQCLINEPRLNGVCISFDYIIETSENHILRNWCCNDQALYESAERFTQQSREIGRNIDTMCKELQTKFIEILESTRRIMLATHQAVVMKKNSLLKEYNQVTRRKELKDIILDPHLSKEVKETQLKKLNKDVSQPRVIAVVERILKELHDMKIDKGIDKSSICDEITANVVSRLSVTYQGEQLYDRRLNPMSPLKRGFPTSFPSLQSLPSIEILQEGNGEYVGEIKQHIRNGLGSYRYPNGDVFVGEWKGDRKHGQGTKTWSNGDKYIGEYKEGNKHGQGTFTWASNNKYVGEWKDDKKHGQGQKIWTNGNKYIGEWVGGKRHGKGNFTWANGNSYVGEWKNSKFNGQGTFTYANGNQYQGEFKDSKFNGIGKMIVSGITMQEGIWKEDLFVGRKY